MKPTDPTASIFSLLVRIWHHLEKRRQQQVGLGLVLMLVSAFAEIISLGAVRTPFVPPPPLMRVTPLLADLRYLLALPVRPVGRRFVVAFLRMGLL